MQNRWKEAIPTVGLLCTFPHSYVKGFHTSYSDQVWCSCQSKVTFEEKSFLGVDKSSYRAFYEAIFDKRSLNWLG